MASNLTRDWWTEARAVWPTTRTCCCCHGETSLWEARQESHPITQRVHLMHPPRLDPPPGTAQKADCLRFLTRDKWVRSSELQTPSPCEYPQGEERGCKQVSGRDLRATRCKSRDAMPGDGVVVVARWLNFAATRPSCHGASRQMDQAADSRARVGRRICATTGGCKTSSGAAAQRFVLGNCCSTW